MSTKNKLKLLIPNILTGLRLILTPLIIAMGINNNFKIVIILIVISTLTDFFDGKLARYFNTVSEFGAKLDAVSDKVFAIGLSLAILPHYKSLLPIIILEVIIAIINLYFYYSKGEVKSLMVGKFKTASLFITIIIAYFLIVVGKFNFVNNLLTGFIYITINLQFLAILFYLSYNFNKKDNQQIETKTLDSELEKTILVENIEDLIYEKNYDDII